MVLNSNRRDEPWRRDLISRAIKVGDRTATNVIRVPKFGRAADTMATVAIVAKINGSPIDASLAPELSLLFHGFFICSPSDYIGRAPLREYVL